MTALTPILDVLIDLIIMLVEMLVPIIEILLVPLMSQIEFIAELLEMVAPLIEIIGKVLQAILVPAIRVLNFVFDSGEHFSRFLMVLMFITEAGNNTWLIMIAPEECLPTTTFLHLCLPIIE